MLSPLCTDTHPFEGGGNNESVIFRSSTCGQKMIKISSNFAPSSTQIIQHYLSHLHASSENHLNCESRSTSSSSSTTYLTFFMCSFTNHHHDEDAIRNHLSRFGAVAADPLPPSTFFSSIVS